MKVIGLKVFWTYYDSPFTNRDEFRSSDVFLSEECAKEQGKQLAKELLRPYSFPEVYDVTLKIYDAQITDTGVKYDELLCECKYEDTDFYTDEELYEY